MSGANQDLPSEAIAALERGSKIEAIKCVRVARGVGLKEAKDIVEQFIESRPEVKRRMAAANAESAKGALRWILMLVAAGLATYYLLFGKH
jgi:ribosomal protein L7/L12